MRPSEKVASRVGLARVAPPARRLAQKLGPHVAPAIVGRAKLVGHEVAAGAPGPSLQRRPRAARRAPAGAPPARPPRPRRPAPRRPGRSAARRHAAGRSRGSQPARAAPPSSAVAHIGQRLDDAALRDRLGRQILLGACSQTRRRDGPGTASRACRGCRHRPGRRTALPEVGAQQRRRIALRRQRKIGQAPCSIAAAGHPAARRAQSAKGAPWSRRATAIERRQAHPIGLELVVVRARQRPVEVGERRRSRSRRGRARRRGTGARRRLRPCAPRRAFRASNAAGGCSILAPPRSYGGQSAPPRPTAAAGRRRAPCRASDWRSTARRSSRRPSSCGSSDRSRGDRRPRPCRSGRSPCGSPGTAPARSC